MVCSTRSTCLLELVDGQAGDLAVEQRGGAGLAHQEAHGGEHAQAAVHNLGLAQALDLIDALVGQEAERVEQAEGGADARHALDVVLHARRRQDDGVNDVNDAVVDGDVGGHHLGAVHLDASGADVKLHLAALQRGGLHAVGQRGAHHLARHDCTGEALLERQPVQKRPSAAAPWNLRMLASVGRSSSCALDSFSAASALTNASLVGANTVNGPGPDSAPARLA